MIKIIGKRWVPEKLLHIEKNICWISIRKEKLDGISDNVLLQNLNELVLSGFMLKRLYQQVLLQVEYDLSQSGQSLVNLLHEMCNWAKINVEV